MLAKTLKQIPAYAPQIKTAKNSLSLAFYTRMYSVAPAKTKSFTDLATLSSIVEVTKASPKFKKFDRSLFVCVQHGLSSTVDLLKGLTELGAKPEHIFWLGKSYSNNPMVVKEIEDLGVKVKSNSRQMVYGDFDESFAHDVSVLWEEIRNYYRKNRSEIDTIVVMDDGGKCLRATPHELFYMKGLSVIGIEQTSSGLNGVTQRHPLPVINVAGCALKAIIETPLISKAVRIKSAEELEPFLIGKKTVSVIGYGKVGKMIAKMFADSGHLVLVYDPKLKDFDSFIHPNIRPVGHIGQAYAASNIIIGCSGVDITAGEALTLVKTGNDKVLVSCSSRDVEFKTLLEHIQAMRPLKENDDPLKTIHYKAPHNSLEVTILAGGFPINFDGSRDSVPRHEIQGTRAALLGAAIFAQYLAELQISHPEALAHKAGSPNFIKLPACLQQFIFNSWKPSLPPALYSPEDFATFEDLEKIQEKSMGKKVNFVSSPFSEESYARYKATLSCAPSNDKEIDLLSKKCP
ncbi:MAG: hypothetical protein Q7V63_06930 [Gammaproteobacteria bacterium]|nr:hypothetical protein [Gammaproteobacteria bacterium]